MSSRFHFMERVQQAMFPWLRHNCYLIECTRHQSTQKPTIWERCGQLRASLARKIFFIFCLRPQFSTFEADPFPTRSCPWKRTNIGLCRLLVVYYSHFYKVERISMATFFQDFFKEFLFLFVLLKPFMIFWGFSFLLVSSCRGAQATSQRAREAEPTEAAAICPKLKTKLTKPSPEKVSQKRSKQKEHKRTIGH